MQRPPESPSSPDRPLVSVVVPAHNAALTIAQTLESVGRQTYRAIEIVIVDDGSEDDTARVAQAFCVRDSRARLVSTPNNGVAAARNIGIAASSGRFVAPIDSDDLWHPSYLAKLVERLTLDAERPPVLAYALHEVIDERGARLRRGLPFCETGHATYRMYYCNIVGNGSAMVMCRKALERAGGYDSRLRALGCEGCEDYLLQLMLCSEGAIACVPEYLVGYRAGSAAMSSDTRRIVKSLRAARALFRDAHPEMAAPSWLERWVAGETSLFEARANFGRGKLLMAVGLLIRGTLLDPAASVTLALGSVHAWLRTLRSARGASHAPASALRELQRRRLSRLAVLDAIDP